MRGRLIFPFVAEIAQLDTVATAADPDAAGPLISGYDDDFREVVHVSDGTTAGASAREEKDLIQVPCQVEIGVWENQRMVVSTGDTPDSRIVCVFHFRDLENMGLVDSATGEALIRTNDRLVAIRKCPSLDLVQNFPNPPGLYATQPRISGFGLGSLERNLLIVTFDDREQGLLRAAS